MQIDATAKTDSELVDRVAWAINRTWNEFGAVPFPLYQFEAEKLAESAIAAIRGADDQ